MMIRDPINGTADLKEALQKIGSMSRNKIMVQLQENKILTQTLMDKVRQHKVRQHFGDQRRWSVIPDEHVGWYFSRDHGVQNSRPNTLVGIPDHCQNYRPTTMVENSQRSTVVRISQ
ncbi:hypothetical protein YC2023_050947 [Brassica napus]